MWIRTKDGWYIHELRGVSYVSWVIEADKENALLFPLDKIDEWIELMRRWTGKELEAVKPF